MSFLCSLKKNCQCPIDFLTLIFCVIFIVSFKGSIYIDYPAYEDDDEEEEEEEVEVDPIISVYGHKFEQYMTGGMNSGILVTSVGFYFQTVPISTQF